MVKSTGIADFDLVIIGAGSAGFSAAITGADAGARVAIVNYGTIGGTCVNVGCVPSKTLIRAAEVIHHANKGNRFEGIKASGSLTGWGSVIKQKDDLVNGLRQAKYTDLLPKYPNITLVEGKAKVLRQGVEVNGIILRAPKMIITTGAAASTPLIEGFDKVSYLTSTSAFELAQLPKFLIIIGGGAIGCEVGQMFARMGVEVTILCRSRLLPKEEPEISRALETYLKEDGVKVICGAAYQSIREDNGICLCYDHEGQTHRLTADQVLAATGRKANSSGMGLEELGVKLVPNGGIAVDQHLQTSVPGIYAAGDVTGRDQYVYMAAYGGKVAAHNALNGNSLIYNNSAMPGIVFTDPQVASVGLTESQGKDKGFDIKTSVLSLEHVPRALAAPDTRGLLKLVADHQTGQLLGAHILAPEGADAIQTAALAIKQGLTTRDLADMIVPYLTTVEGLKLAAIAFEKDVEALSCCAG